ncbi:MAG: cytochrome bc1 complex cytochrome b subunit [Actinoallomurus sp.]
MSTETRVAQATGAIDDRFGTSSFFKKAVKKAFPDHWSFLLGEIALYSFAILVLTGVFLTLFFKPSANEVIYHGTVTQLQGLKMSEAYASTLHMSFDVRGGLLMRQIHHWSALLFLGAMLVHMLRIFFTGAFRKPREISYLLGFTLMLLGILEGFAGYSLPDDLLSGTGLRIAQGVVQSIPVGGTYLSFFLFGGQFPGTDLIPRLYILHVLLVPGIMLALVPLHGIILPWRLMHTHYPTKRRTETNQIGGPFFPVFVLKTGGFFLFTFAVSAGLATFFQINPVWLFGPYTPDAITAGSQPDWYLGFLEGALRVMPNWEVAIAGHPISLNILIPGVVIPGILFTGLAVYPFFERWVTRDYQIHNVLDRPRNAATRTSIGAAGVTFYGSLWLAGGNDLIATRLNISLFTTTWIFRFVILFGPFVAYFITKRICLGLQYRDRELYEHGLETGVIRQLPSGEFQEVVRPAGEEVDGVMAHKKPIPALPADADDDGIPAPGSQRLLSRLRTNLHRIYTEDYVPVNGNGNGNGHAAISGNGHAVNGNGNGNGNGHAVSGEDRVALSAGTTGDEPDEQH